ncbi:hypothetical protein [Cohnella herbarum]|uniref:Uncharacterized protein n=1 Tax=Cohnella herbarum TaxID=2728023 RepID=A0A7Z2VI67_9BACL|nr:hypothetical protein [Cohnella herbarum]QJD83499.1 hypothetical protein HH215_10100 [Cohnella herbarum]
MLNIARKAAITTGAAMLFIGTQGCQLISTSLPADKAFAMSASALSGSERYGFAGEVSVLDPGGFVGGRAAFEGEVTMHGKLSMQWKSNSSATMEVNSQQTTAYRPLQLLESIKGDSATITYAEKPVPNQPVRMQIKLDDTVARDRLAQVLRDDFALLRADNGLLRGDPAKAEQILLAANKRLEEALSTLEVTTVCQWTADPKSWFPSQLKEESTLSYRWNGKPYKEKRISETNFSLKG